MLVADPESCAKLDSKTGNCQKYGPRRSGASQWCYSLLHNGLLTAGLLFCDAEKAGKC